MAAAISQIAFQVGRILSFIQCCNFKLEDWFDQLKSFFLVMQFPDSF